MSVKNKPGFRKTKPAGASKTEVSEDEDSSRLLQRSIALPNWMWNAIDSYVEKNKKIRWRPSVRSRNRFFEELCLEEIDRIKTLEAAGRDGEVVARLAVLEEAVRIKQQAS